MESVPEGDEGLVERAPEDGAARTDSAQEDIRGLEIERPARVEEGVVVTDVIVVVDGEVVEEIIDIEEYVKAGRTPHPRAKGYLVRVDKQKLLFHKAEVTGREILEKAGKQPPDRYILRQVLKGGALEKVGLNQVVDLARHGVEKFKTMLKTAQDGRS